MINSLKDTTSPKVIRGTYFACFHAHMKYGLIRRDSGADSKDIFQLQNTVTQLIRDVGRHTSCREISKALNKFSVACMHIQQVKQYAIT